MSKNNYIGVPYTGPTPEPINKGVSIAKRICFLLVVNSPTIYVLWLLHYNYPALGSDGYAYLESAFFIVFAGFCWYGCANTRTKKDDEEEGIILSILDAIGGTLLPLAFYSLLYIPVLRITLDCPIAS